MSAAAPKLHTTGKSVRPGERRIVVVMPGHLSTTPRMMKAADAFAHAGYQVRVVSATYQEWSREADRTLAPTRPWRWTPVEHGRVEASALYTLSGARRHCARTITRMVGADGAPWWAVTRAMSRAHDELVKAALAEPFDLIYGGSVGGLAVVEEVARRAG